MVLADQAATPHREKPCLHLEGTGHEPRIAAAKRSTSAEPCVEGCHHHPSLGKRCLRLSESESIADVWKRLVSFWLWFGSNSKTFQDVAKKWPMEFVHRRLLNAEMHPGCKAHFALQHFPGEKRPLRRRIIRWSATSLRFQDFSRKLIATQHHFKLLLPMQLSIKKFCTLTLPVRSGSNNAKVAFLDAFGKPQVTVVACRTRSKTIKFPYQETNIIPCSNIWSYAHTFYVYVCTWIYSYVQIWCIHIVIVYQHHLNIPLVLFAAHTPRPH